MPLVLQASALDGVLSVLCHNADRQAQNWLQASSLNCGSEQKVEKYDARRQLSARKPSLTQK